ncbi:WD40 repeat-like protein [Tothia fuscella]|uniref:WD40 repeat-like protein n=1 Tax=Tothia fuscella TaxID=1048955 RepID=A0A9P4TSE9_9PEZI|nr:WD40 repeat-like protein [Tothia fuscella]
MAPRIRGRPAHTPGPTFLSYTPDGTKLVTVGLNNSIRVFHTGSDAEPTTIDNCQDNNTAVAAANDFFVIGCEDGTVCKYSLESNTFEGILTRCTLPIRDVALSPDGQWVAVASDELVVKVVNTSDMDRVMYLRDQPRAAKHVSFDKSGSSLSVSCTDGKIYVYSLSTEEPELIQKVDGLIKSLETESESSSKVIWHPDGRAFVAPTATRDMQVMSRGDWERQRVFKDGHTSDITAAAWSPNGAMLVTTSVDRKLLLWDTKSQKVLQTLDASDIRATILAMAWHPSENILSYSNNDGELYIHTNFVPEQLGHLLTKGLQPAPFIHDPLQDTSGNARRPANGLKNGLPERSVRRGTPDSLDEILGMEVDDDETADGFIVDDDEAGYAEETNKYGKRPSNGAMAAPAVKRRPYTQWQPQIHESFQPGSTPWRGNRKYLALNLTGFVWTVDQETHNTVTVQFFDREFHRDFHFTDAWMYDKACLNEHGTLFSCPPRDTHPAQLYYRPHETWTTRTEWRTQLPAGETITAIALSDSYIVATTSANYVRIFTLFGVPCRVYRQKSSPTVTCAAWRDYVLTIGNGPVGGDGRTQLLYTLENVKRDEVCQSEDIVALTEGTELQSVFFSDTGDPCIYDTKGTLLVLLHWRTSGQAKWVPLLDTTQLQRLASGKKEERYWPVAVAQEKFHCIILKGGDQYPYFPRPLLTDFDFKIPLCTSPTQTPNDDTTPTESEPQKLEHAYVLSSVQLSLLEDLLSATRASHTQKVELSKKEVEVDKTLIQLLAAECREGEERGMRALEIVGLIRDRSGRMLEAAQKVAHRYGREVLGGKINELAERRLVGLVDEEEL